MQIDNITSIRNNIDSCVIAQLSKNASLSDKDFVSKMLSFEKQLTDAFKREYILS